VGDATNIDTGRIEMASGVVQGVGNADKQFLTGTEPMILLKIFPQKFHCYHVSLLAFMTKTRSQKSQTN